MNVSERAERDLQRGDYAKARQRLESRLRTKGYDPDLLARIGQIAYDMHDPYTAGRMWLLSSATGERVEGTVELLLERVNGNARRALFETPRAARRPTLDEYPELVRERLRRYGMVEHLESVYRGPSQPPRPETWGEKLMPVVFLALALLLVGSCSVGAVSIVTWLFG